jgi:hypothetical protein
VVWVGLSEDDEESAISESVLSEDSGDIDVLQDDASKVLHITDKSCLHQRKSKWLTLLLEDEALSSRNVIEDDIDLPAATPQAK